MKDLKSVCLIICPMALASVVHAGNIYETVSTSTTVTFTQYGNVVGLHAAGGGAADLWSQLSGQLQGTGPTSGQCWNIQTISTSIQLWYESTSSGDSPPTTVYDHSFVNGTAYSVAINPGPGGNVQCTNRGAVQAWSGVGLTPPFSVSNLGWAGSSSSTSYGVSWTLVNTMGNGNKIYKSTSPITVSAPRLMINAICTGSSGAYAFDSEASGQGILFTTTP